MPGEVDVDEWKSMKNFKDNRSRHLNTLWEIALRSFVLSALVLFIHVCQVHAQNASNLRRRLDNDKASLRFELDEIVVTATKTREQITEIPRNITVITAEEIAQASSNNVVDLLSKETGITLQSSFGTDKWTKIDIRGMGDTSADNVLVIVDGIRLNPPDMAGPDLSSIALEEIERIEIMRGPGSVMYGDGAVGGVISIITKKGSETPKAHLYSSYGSYDTKDLRLSLIGKAYGCLLNLNSACYDSKGYRDNGGLKKKDGSLYAGYTITDHINLSVDGSVHEDTYGLPGNVSKEDKDSREMRKSTLRPDDFGETRDARASATMEIDLESHGQITIQRGYRFRENPYIQGFNPQKSKEAQTDRIDEDTRDFYGGYNTTYILGGLEHRFQVGVDHYATEYTSEEITRSRRKNYRIRNLGVFLTNDWRMSNDLVLRIGYRNNQYKIHYRKDKHEPFNEKERWENGEVASTKWVNDPYEIGATYSFTPHTTIFASAAKSFRVPDVDEMAFGKEGLHPQEGMHYEIGLRNQWQGIAELALSLFRAEIDDEIRYTEDPVTGERLNRNYKEKTFREGLEIDVKLFPKDFLYIWGNYSYMTAKLKESGTDIPLVPRHKSSIGMEFQASKKLAFTISGSFIGSSFDGNDDMNNNFEKLGGYEVIDTRVNYTYDSLKLFAGVNNLFDEMYSTVSYGETYYPMPTRNFYGGMEWRF